MPSASPGNQQVIVAEASPEPARSPAAFISFTQSTISQVDHLIGTIQHDAIGVVETVDQKIVQGLSFAWLQWNRLLGVNPNAPNSASTSASPASNDSGSGRGNSSGSGSGSGTVTSSQTTSNQTYNTSTQQAGRGSGSGSSSTNSTTVSKQGMIKLHPLTGSGGSGTGSESTDIVEGQVWLDNNGNGTKDIANGEQGWPAGATVNLLTAPPTGNGQLVDTTTTDQYGDYEFLIPVGGVTVYYYQVQVVSPPYDEPTIEGSDSQINDQGLSQAFGLAPGAPPKVVNAGIRSMNVTTLDDDPNAIIPGQITLRDAIKTGNDGPPNPAVTFIDPKTNQGLNGTISLQKGLDPIEKSYNIDGSAGEASITVQGNGNPNSPYRIFTINTGVSIAINALTIKGGFDESGAGGGAISNSGDLILENSVLSGNFSSADGGAILNGTSASLRLSNDVIENNSAAVNGGGIENFGTLSYLDSSTTQIISNEAQGGNGGGIYNLGRVDFDNTGTVKIVQNTALFDGGGVYNGSAGNFNMGHLNSAIASNTAGQYGGGLYNLGTTTLDNNLGVGSNQANKGGGLYLDVNSTTNLDLIVVGNNQLVGSGSAGKGIYQVIGANLPIYSNVTDTDDPGGEPVQGH